MAEEQDQQFVEYVLKTVVDHPDDVKVERTIDEMGVLISVTVHPDDMGKVIGKSGQTAKAIRTLLKVVGAKRDARVNMKIIEPDGSAAPARDDQQGATDDADDVPAEESSTEEAVAEQVTSDAAQPQPSENDSAVDEATGEPQAQEPPTEQPQDQSTAADDLRQARERSPLDDL